MPDPNKCRRCIWSPDHAVHKPGARGSWMAQAHRFEPRPTTEEYVEELAEARDSLDALHFAGIGYDSEDVVILRNRIRFLKAVIETREASL